MNEIVMCDNMTVDVLRNNERLIIKSNGLLEREYLLKEFNVKTKLMRRKDRWNGSYGLYKQQGGGDIHLVLEEGYQYFYSEKEAIEWLSWQNERMNYVYTSNGLVVGWEVQNKADKSNQKSLAVQVWQFYIRGKKPNKLNGGDDKSINAINSDCIPDYSDNFIPSRPKVINGRLYTGKAIDMMNEQNVKSNVIEDTIKSGESFTDNGFITYYNLDPNTSKFIWVKLDASGRVVLVGR